MGKIFDRSFGAVICFMCFTFFLFINCDKRDNLSDATFKPINSATPNQSANQSRLLIGTWYLSALFEDDGTTKTLSECDKKQSATYKTDGTCTHRRYTVVKERCELAEMYSCTYIFEFDIITSVSASGTLKSIVKIPDSKTLEVYNNVGEKIAVYKKPR